VLARLKEGKYHWQICLFIGSINMVIGAMEVVNVDMILGTSEH
jgi:hypothetical protein